MAEDLKEQIEREDAERAAARTLSDRQAAARAAEEKSIRKKRIKQANDPDEGNTLVTITKFGDGKVSTGVHVAGVGDVYAKKGDVLEVSEDVAEALERSGFAETAD